MLPRLAAVCAAALSLAAAALAAPAPPAPPQGLHAFLLRADEPVRRSFPRTPSFAWQPVPGTKRYDFQLARSRDFGGGTIVYQAGALHAPAVSVPLSLPWMTGTPYALYARVRAITSDGVSAWSAPFGFNTSWTSMPEPVRPTIPGLVRWTPVEGATGYQVWYPDAGKIFQTLTNVADEREFYAFHQDPKWTGTVRWRVRAVRRLFGGGLGGLPAVSYGPWTDVFVERNPKLAQRALRVVGTVSESTASPHAVTPGFYWSGNRDANGGVHPLYRAYVFTDPGCVNVVFRGAIVGSPAYAPRSTGPLELPASGTDVDEAASLYLRDGKEPKSYTADYLAVTASESVTGKDARTKDDGGDGTSLPSENAVPGALVDLWDSGWPSGRYYWTVVPVEPTISEGRDLEYRDVELPQDVCRSGRRGSFGKSSRPAVTAAGAAFASGLSPRGRLVAAAGAAPTFYGSPLVAWQPVEAASGYELEVSRTTYPWRPAGKRVSTPATSTLLTGLAPGTWYYRVRGVDPFVPGGAKQLAWSKPQRIEIAQPVFAISR